MDAGTRAMQGAIAGSLTTINKIMHQQPPITQSA